MCNVFPRHVVMGLECTRVRAEVESLDVESVLQADCALMSMSDWLPHVESYDRDRFLLWEAEVPGDD